MFAPKVEKAQSKTATRSAHALLLAQQNSSPATTQFDAVLAGEAERRQILDQTAIPVLSWDFGKIPLFPPERAYRSHGSSRQPGIIQAKLVVGRANDPLEHEADSVADQIMRIPAPQAAISAAAPDLRRACAACADEEVQRSALSPAVVGGNAVPAAVHRVLAQPGRPLDADTRAFFEPRFRRNLGHVRLHDDDRAAQSARAVGAHAYTVSNNIAFANKVDTASDSGRRLLAHELTHTVQQGDGATARQMPQLQRQALAGTDSEAMKDPDCPPERPYRWGPKRGPGGADPAVVAPCMATPTPHSQRNPLSSGTALEQPPAESQVPPSPVPPATTPPQPAQLPQAAAPSAPALSPHFGSKDQPAGGEGREYDFEDDPLSSGGFGPNDATIRVRPGPVRSTLIRPGTAQATPVQPRMTDLDGQTLLRPQLSDPAAWTQDFLVFFNLSPALDPLSTGPEPSQKYLFRRAILQRFLNLDQVIDIVIEQGALDGHKISRDMALSAILARVPASTPPGPSTSRAAVYLSVSAVRTGHQDTSTGKFTQPDQPGVQEAFQVTWEIHEENKSGPELSWTGQLTEFRDAPGGPLKPPGQWKLQSAYTGPQAAWVFAFLKGSLQIGPIAQALGGGARAQQSASTTIKMVWTGQVALGGQLVFVIPGTGEHLQIGGQWAAALTAPAGAPSTVDFAESAVLQWKF